MNLLYARFGHDFASPFLLWSKGKPFPLKVLLSQHTFVLTRRRTALLLSRVLGMRCLHIVSGGFFSAPPAWIGMEKIRRNGRI
jgi:hypothetical protein